MRACLGILIVFCLTVGCLVTGKISSCHAITTNPGICTAEFLLAKQIINQDVHQALLPITLFSAAAAQVIIYNRNLIQEIESFYAQTWHAYTHLPPPIIRQMKKQKMHLIKPDLDTDSAIV